MNSNPQKLGRKKELCFEISAAVKTVQRQYISCAVSDGKRSDDTTEKKAQAVERLCIAVEAVFLHELKNSKCVLWRETKNLDPATLPEPSFWVFIEPMVSDEIKIQLLALRNSESDVRKCRSWVRLMLAKSLMVNFLEDLLRHPGLVRFHYGDNALLRDAEQSGIVIQLLRGLAVLNLPYDYAGHKLDTWDHAVLMLAGIWAGPHESPLSREKTTASPTHTSPSVQRVSPPASDFLFEGETIIGMAMDKYVKRKASKSSMSDSQLLSREIAERLNPTPKLTRRDGGSGSSVESNGSMFEAEPPSSGSYGAMLRSYARKTEPQVGGGDTGAMGSETRGGEEVGPGGWREREEEVEGEGEGEKEGNENFGIAHSLNYEIISSDGSLVESQKNELNQQQRLVMVEHLVKLVPEKGLDSQNYMCDGCKRNIGLIFGQPKLCKFNGQHYCYDCHRDDERIIPARVLFNWDFRPHKVCLASCEFLDSVERSAVLDVAEINKALYLYIPALQESLKLRQQCKHLKDYLSTCKEQEVLDQFRKRLKSSHIYEDVHKYSIRDLIDVNSGVLSERLKKLVKFGTKHVKQCALCSQKGFICEVCHNPKVIYPFDFTETTQCEVCHSVYHKVCHPVKGSCPKCLRLRKRANSVDLFT